MQVVRRRGSTEAQAELMGLDRRIASCDRSVGSIYVHTWHLADFSRPSIHVRCRGLAKGDMPGSIDLSP